MGVRNMNWEWTLFQFPLKNTKNSSEFLIKTNKHITQCLDVVKVNPPKKLSRDPRRLASNSRLAVSLGTLYVSFTFYIRWERDMDDAFWKCVRSSNNTILKLQALTLNSLSIHKQIPQGWQIRHPCWCWCPGLLGRGLGILSGWSSRTRR